MLLRTSRINDVERKIFDRLPDETWFYPGHGKDSTLGAERPHLPECTGVVRYSAPELIEEPDPSFPQPAADASAPPDTSTQEGGK